MAGVCIRVGSERVLLAAGELRKFLLLAPDAMAG
jgi:hypothetical protein